MDDRRDNDLSGSRRGKIAELAGAYAAALLSADEIAAEIAIREAMDTGLTTAEIDEELIAPALWLVGKLWERGKISVAEEHLATEISLRVLALQREAQRVAESRGSHRVLLAAPSGELHVVALRMVANLLRGGGYDVLMLGADVPAPALGSAARHHEAEVICLSSTMPGQADRVLTAVDEVRREWPSAGFVIGGQALSLESEARAQVRVCARVSEVVEAVDAMVKRAGMN
jgi:methanogenic corrinoid protein MtbC1